MLIVADRVTAQDIYVRHREHIPGKIYIYFFRLRFCLRNITSRIDLMLITLKTFSVLKGNGL